MSKTIEELERENARLLTVIANALQALNDGRRGDVRRWLVKGECKPVVAGSSVIAWPGSK